jgi:putative RNA 2'-phosphotransferase
VDGMIRAFYGQSIREKILKEPTVHPIILYHGTKDNRFEKIFNTEIWSMNRQYVHLRENTASRKKGKSILLKKNAFQACVNEVSFYKKIKFIYLNLYLIYVKIL